MEVLIFGTNGWKTSIYAPQLIFTKFNIKVQVVDVITLAKNFGDQLRDVDTVG